MFKYQLLIEYEGTNFRGWQIQKKGKTIQGLIQEKISKILKEKIILSGSGRTDTGVHALEQSAHFECKKRIINYDKFYTEIQTYIQKLNNTNSSPSKSITDNDFLMQIKSKLHIPAGDNFFDMPSYLNFLSSNKTFILENIYNWYAPFKPIFMSSILLLDFKRTISKFKYFSSNDSFFEMKLDKSDKTDLVRIKLEKNINIYPDISVNSQNINIMFKTSYGANRQSKPIEEKLDFGISLSNIK